MDGLNRYLRHVPVFKPSSDLFGDAVVESTEEYPARILGVACTLHDRSRLTRASHSVNDTMAFAGANEVEDAFLLRSEGQW